MADQVQRYRPAPLSTVKKFLVRTDTTLIPIPGHPPVQVQVSRPRWWLLPLAMVPVVIGTVFVMTRLLTVPAGVTRGPGATACRPDTVHLIVSKIKDRLQVFVDATLVTEITYGQVVNLDGSVERGMKGPGWGQLNLTPHLAEGDHTLRLVALHDKGDDAGAVAEVRYNDKTLRVVSHKYDVHDRHGVFLDQSIPLTVHTCQEANHERGQ